jgi:hypothetical protein
VVERQQYVVIDAAKCVESRKLASMRSKSAAARSIKSPSEANQCPAVILLLNVVTGVSDRDAKSVRRGRPRSSYV